jgi:hypothetical protein
LTEQNIPLLSSETLMIQMQPKSAWLFSY